MPRPHFEIDFKETGAASCITMDGIELQGVRQVKIECGVGQSTIVVLEFVGTVSGTAEGDVVSVFEEDMKAST